MVTQKVLENWLYWLVIDAIAAYLYFDRGLYLTSLLFYLYLVIVIFGYLQWRKLYRQQKFTTAVAPLAENPGIS
jgi:nicotinamide mononucleotide transporter